MIFCREPGPAGRPRLHPEFLIEINSGGARAQIVSFFACQLLIGTAGVFRILQEDPISLDVDADLTHLPLPGKALKRVLAVRGHTTNAIADGEFHGPSSLPGNRITDSVVLNIKRNAKVNGPDSGMPGIGRESVRCFSLIVLTATPFEIGVSLADKHRIIMHQTEYESVSLLHWKVEIQWRIHQYCDQLFHIFRSHDASLSFTMFSYHFHSIQRATMAG